ncbi:MAG: cell division protein FtsQ/DivIB [Terriglobales bacterium]
MARKNGPLIPGDDAESTSRAYPRAEVEDESLSGADDSRTLDLEPEEQSPFLRAQKRVPVRRGPLRKKAANRLKAVLVVLATVAGVSILVGGAYRYTRTSWRFRIESSDHIQITGIHNVSRKQVLEVFGGDISRNVFSIPLEERKRQVEQIPWVESATLMRFLPNRLKLEIRERKPVAFVQIGAKISLIDDEGVVMEMPSGGLKKYSFPVIVGIKSTEPLSTRAARMKIYSALISELDSGGSYYSRDLSEVNLSDPQDVKVTVTDKGGEVLIHLGSSNFLERYKVYIAHVQEWRQRFQKLDSVDLRYDRQVIVNPDTRAVKAVEGKP